MEEGQMTKHAATIRADLYELVTARLFEKGVDSLLDFSRKVGDVAELFDEPLCPFVNRLCPDDLCYLPAGHVGSKEGYHITGTTAYDYAIKWGFGKKDMAEVGTSRGALIQMGAKLQRDDATLQ
jgi:hypothetical protein